jgi:hypothetical protein
MLWFSNFPKDFGIYELVLILAAFAVMAVSILGILIW